MTIQDDSNKIERRWNRAAGSASDALQDFSDLANNAGMSQADKDLLEQKRQAVLDAIADYCQTARNLAPGIGVTPQSGGGPK